VAVAPELTN